MAGNKRPLFGMESNGMNRIPGTPKLDPFLNPRPNPLDPVIPTTPDIVKRVRDTYNDPVPIILPRQMAAPEGARTIDLTKAMTVPAGATLDLYTIQCKPGASTVLMGYAIWTDAAIGSDLTWLPTVDNNRVLQFHGAPQANGVNQIQFPVGNNTQLAQLVPCQILLEPGQIFKWQVRNNTGAPVTMAARTVGYLDMSQRLTSSKFGD